MEFLRKINAFCEEQELLPAGGSVIVAVSGGADSVALLDILAGMGMVERRLVVAHLNHGLRGEESDADEAFVRALASGYGLPCECETTDVKGIASLEKLSLEDAGRQVRYAFFERVAAKYGAHYIALGHHADDQAETVLMRLLRGAGSAGLAAMLPKSAGKYVRPLLCVTRREIEAYLRQRNIGFRVDSSNADNCFLRNRIRNELLPVLSTYNPSIKERLVATAGIAAADEELLEKLTAKAMARCSRSSEKDLVLDAGLTRMELKGLRLRLYRHCIAEVKGSLSRISFLHLCNIDELLFSKKPNASLNLPDGVRVERSYDFLVFKAQQSTSPRDLASEVIIAGPGTYEFPNGGKIVVTLLDSVTELCSRSRWISGFDLGLAPFPWRIRTFRPGDRIAPQGMPGRKKIKDIFIDGKVPATMRTLVPLVFCEEDLIWAVGFRASRVAQVTDKTAAVVIAEFVGGIVNDL